MTPFEKLLANNRGWARGRVDSDPDFFKHLASQQSPEFLWIGCSDSRVSANEVTGTQPGEIFVQRNMANLVVATDINLLTVLEYAVRYLNVQHIIVCGHYGCGGIAAAMSNTNMGVINRWLSHIKDLYLVHRVQLDAITDEKARLNRLCELNVHQQVMNLTKTSIIQQTWRNENRPHLHGWAYGLDDGIIKPLVHLTPETSVEPIYRYSDV